MRMTPVKARTAFRGIWVRFLLWMAIVRMKELYGNPDVWFTESKSPRGGSPWDQTRAYGNTLSPLASGGVIHAVEAEAELRFDAARDYFAGMRSVARPRSVYSLYAMCRSTIEACAYASWVLDPHVEPEVRIQRGLLLLKKSLEEAKGSLKQELEVGHKNGTSDQEYLLDAKKAKGNAEALLVEVKQAVKQTQSDLQMRTGQASANPPSLPSKTQRVRELFLEDMDMPHGSDAYHRMSGVAHSEALAISGTWNLNRGKPSIDYYDFLVYLQLAVCSIDFSMERRAVCWGDTHKGKGLHRVIRRLERIIAGESEVQFV